MKTGALVRFGPGTEHTRGALPGTGRCGRAHVFRQRGNSALRVKIVLVQGRQFHVKAAAAWGSSLTQVYIGSANFTDRGQYRNHEVLLGAHKKKTLRELRKALKSLVREHRTMSLTCQTDLHRADHALQQVWTKQEPSESLRWVTSLLQRGCFVQRLDAEPDLRVTVSMQSLYKANVLKRSLSQELGEGITWSRRDAALSVSLVPDEVLSECHEVRQDIGRLLGRCTLEALGRRWVPEGWAASLRASWEQLLVLPDSHRDLVHRHLSRLEALILKRELLKELGGALLKTLNVLPVSGWDVWRDGGLSDSRLKDLSFDVRSAVDVLTRADGRVSKKVRRLVQEAVLTRTQEAVKNRLEPDFVQLQLSQVSTMPALLPVGVLPAADLLVVLIDWTQQTIQPLVRAGSSRKPTNMLAQRLYEYLPKKRSEASRLYRETFEWQRELSRLTEEGPNEARLLRLTEQAAGRFHGLFCGLDWGPWPLRETSDRQLALLEP